MMHYQKEYKEIMRKYETSENGLKTADVKLRIEKYGYNELKEKSKGTIFQLFLESFKDPLVIILLIAAAIQIGTGHVVDSLIILIVLTLNAIVGVVQAKKAESSLEKLRSLSQPNAKVIRDGVKQTIPMKEIVPGDIVVLDAGDYVPGDGRLIEVNALKMKESALTGESEPVVKEIYSLSGELPIGDRKNMVYSGTMAIYGRGIFVVTETGMNTEIGKIANLLENVEGTKTPLQKNLEIFTKKIGVGILGLSIIIFAITVGKGLWLNGDRGIWELILSAFMFSVAVAVAAIPEALSSIVTIVLSVGTHVMAKKNAIIRKLVAVESLGATSVICTDKTGTLTQNKMTVVSNYLKGIESFNFKNTEDKMSQEELFINGFILVNDGELTQDGKEIGDPTEVALLSFGKNNGIDIDNLRKDNQRINELPFDSDRKLMSSLNIYSGKKILFCKGAPDVIFSRVNKILKNGELLEATEEIIDKYKIKNEEFSRGALRVLAIAYKEVSLDKIELSLEDENDLVLIGLVAMIDPPRDEVYQAIKEAKMAGIKTVMITGDHKTTAAAIGKEIGIMSSSDKALTGQELDNLTDDELSMELENITVYARVSPENKIRIVKAWQKKGKITAMTGDGVNDAPALKQADIGISMGTGTDVAKDASAMVLTDDNFVSIVHAVEAGRTVYSNIKKSIIYLFVGNLGAIIAIVFSLFAGWDAPFTALQLLFINLVNDSLPAIALGLEPSDKSIMKAPPRDSKESLFSKSEYITMLYRGSIIAIVTIIAKTIGDPQGELGMSMAFTTLIFARTLQTISARNEEKTAMELGIFKNIYVIGAIIICFVMYLVVLLPSVRLAFRIVDSFGLIQIGICLTLGIISTLIMEGIKLLPRKK